MLHGKPWKYLRDFCAKLCLSHGQNGTPQHPENSSRTEQRRIVFILHVEISRECLRKFGGIASDPPEWHHPADLPPYRARGYRSRDLLQLFLNPLEHVSRLQKGKTLQQARPLAKSKEARTKPTRKNRCFSNHNSGQGISPPGARFCRKKQIRQSGPEKGVITKGVFSLEELSRISKNL